MLLSEESIGLFVTGTDTGVGKTLITAGLAYALQTHGIDVGVMKPVETGCPIRGGRVRPPDAFALREAAGSRDALDLVNPYRFREPVAPMVAAERSGRRIDVEQLLERFGRLADRHTMMLVEGAGGLLVPITEQVSFLDLAARLRLPLLVVIGSRLGALNHARLTVEAALAARVPVAAAVVNRTTAERSPARITNLAALRRLLPVPILGEIPRLSDLRGHALWRSPILQRILTSYLKDLFPELMRR
ncbi:MAG: dethiobiotin synthase [Candidatus Methylomirabilis oxygeniifera]|uniref:ATP-dependent dethiobiotin synthetase BioD n=1 Tax=Methylomirabilis oxygeniifera TaxID=671143 RepID=D5MJW9_METO1|nr:MAG: dethiobiotin synthase [Candidatus Methylomirabilis oxyfera]CBE67552.1 Dethiobiotin synthetase (Dethiobiotin synthase) (DTB synthetase) (DTBS) [Candidatus Methylomirabilis oxyfera]